MPTLTVGTNTYVTVAEADTYFGSSLEGSTVWTTFTQTQKELALLDATKRLNRLGWKGAVNDFNQVLEWPRQGLEDRRGFFVEGTIVPQDIKDAQCEWAFSLLVEDEIPGNGLYQSFTHDKVSAAFWPQVPVLIPRTVTSLLYLYRLSPRVVRA